MLQPSAFPPHGQRKCSYRDSYRGTKVAGRTHTGAIRARYCGPCRYLPVHTPSAPRRRMRTKENKQNGTRPGSEDEPRALSEWVGRLRAVGFPGEVTESDGLQGCAEGCSSEGHYEYFVQPAPPQSVVVRVLTEPPS